MITMIRKDTPDEVEKELKKMFHVESVDIHFCESIRYKNSVGTYRTYESMAIVEIKLTFISKFRLMVLGDTRKRLDIHRALDQLMPENVQTLLFFK